MVHMNHNNHKLQGLPFTHNKQVPEMYKHFCHTKNRGETHLLVLVQTFMCESTRKFGHVTAGRFVIN